MSIATLACIATILVGGYMFLYLAGKETEVRKKDRKISRWAELKAAHARKEERRKEEEMANIAVAEAPTESAFAVAPPPPPAPAEEMEEAQPVGEAE